MKCKTLLFSSMIVSALLLAGSTQGQVTTKIPKNFALNRIVSTEVNAAGQLEVILATETKKKGVSLYQFTFDQALNKVAEADIPFDRDKIKTKRLLSNEEGATRFVRVVPSILADMTLQKGYVQRTYRGYKVIAEQFKSEESFKVRTDNDHKIYPLFEMHDSEVSFSPHDFGYAPEGFNASGDLIALGAVQGKLLTKGREGVGSADAPIDYCVIKASAKTLAVEKKTLIPFEFVQKTEYYRELPGKKMLVVTCDFPMAYKGSEAFYNPTSNQRTVLLINKNAEVAYRQTFKGLPGMEVLAADVTPQGQVFIVARQGKKKDQQLILIHLKGSELVYLKTLNPAELTTAVLPANVKKAPLFKDELASMMPKSRQYEGLVVLDNQHVLFLFQGGNKSAGYLYYLEFDESGSFVRQFAHTVLEKMTYAGDKNAWKPIKVSVRQHANKVYAFITEATKEGEYLSHCRIDCQAGTVGALQALGRPTKQDKNSYYIDKEFSLVDMPGKGVYLIGRSKKETDLWIQTLMFD